MRKILAALLLLPALVHAATWYVRPTGQAYGNSSGTSYANAWTAYNGIVWGSVAAGDTLYICGTWSDTLYVNKAGTLGSNIIFDGACPNDPAKFVAGSAITATGFNFFTVQNFSLNTASISCFGCSTANGGSCSAREGMCDGWLVQNNTLVNPSQSGIWFSAVANQTSYPPITGMKIYKNTITGAQKHAINVAGALSNVVIDSNVVNGANLDHTTSAWGIYVTTRWFIAADGSWTTVGTCAAGGKNLYKITAATAGAGANEVATQIVHNNDANGHYTSVGGCANDGAAAAMADRQWCQNASAAPIYQCGVAPADAAIITSANANPGFVVSNNDVSNADNFNGTQDGVGIGGDWGETNGVFERNWSHDNQGRGLELNFPTSNMEMHSNVASGNGLWGFNYAGVGSTAGSLRLYNNTSNNNGSAAYRLNATSSAGLDWRNNIAANSPSCLNATLATDSNNAVFNCTNSGFVSPLVADPRWISKAPTSPRGFHPTYASPLRAAGTAVGSFQDNANRLFKSPPSIGAFEYAGGDLTPTRAASPTRAKTNTRGVSPARALAQ